MGTATAVENGAAVVDLERREAAQELTRLLSGYWLSRAVQVATELGIPDLVAAEPRGVEEVAAQSGTDCEALYRLMRALASFGYLREFDGRRFASTAISDLLRTGSGGSLRSAMISELGGIHYGAWARLADSVKTGEPAFDRVYGMGPWQYLQQNPAEAALFNDSMTELTDLVHPAVFRAYDFSPFRSVVDVGGGRGRLLRGILEVNSHARGVLMDRAQVIDEAKKELAQSPVSKRMQLVAGDFFKRVPEGADLYTLKWIIHDWALEPALSILRNVRRAMGPNARVILIESVLPEANHGDMGPLMDLNMLVMTGGKERRADEYRELLAAAGLKMTGVKPTESPVSIVEAVAA